MIHKTILGTGCFFVFIFHLFSNVYYVRPDGNNSNSGIGNTPSKAWKTIDRGQPTRLLENISEGQKEIKVLRALQFPSSGTVLINKKPVTYESIKDNYILLNCKGAPEAKKGTIVKSSDWRPPKAGDTVTVEKGVYYSPNNWPDKKVKGLVRAAVSISSGGSKDKPVLFKGIDKPVIDGRHQAWALRFDGASNVIFESFNIRRYGVWIWQSNGIVLKNNLIHEGKGGIFARYSKNIEILNNKVYDLHGAWTGSPITLGAGKNYTVKNNTIVDSGREAIRVFDKTGDNYIIQNNLISRCRKGIKIEKKSTLKPENVKNNCLWNVGRVIWLGRVGQKKEGMEYYDGLSFKPEDIHEDPKIVSFDPESENFLNVAEGSPCALKNGIVGAGKVIKHPKANDNNGLNPIVNPGFEAGWFGWKKRTWQSHKPGQAGWDIVSKDGQTGKACLEIYHYPEKGQLGVAVYSSFIRIDRGYPVTISFRVKGKRKDGKPVTFAAGLLVPSWHYGSLSAKKNFRADKDWKTCSVELNPNDYYPNIVSVYFTVLSSGKIWIDDVSIVQHSKTKGQNQVRLELAENIPGNLLRHDSPVKLNVYDSRKKPEKLELIYKFETPDGAVSMECKKTLEAKNKSLVEINPPEGFSGAALLRVKLLAGKAVLASKIYRLLIGDPAPDGRNKDFFGANPVPGFRNPDKLEEARKDYKTAAALGIGVWHYYPNFDRLQDLYNEKWTEDLINAARDAGIEWLMTLENNKLFTGKRAFAPGPGNLGDLKNGPLKFKGLAGKRVTEEQLKAWEQWVRAVAEKYKDKVKYWEICNEPNCYLNADEYMKILKRTSKTLRKAAPDSIIIGGSIVNAYRQPIWNKTIFEGHKYFDQFSYHPYRFGLQNPEYGGFSNGLKTAKDDIKKAGSKARINLTEEYRTFGPPMTDYSQTEKIEANCLARMYARAMGENCAAYHHHHELFRNSNLSPNLGLMAVHTMATLLNDAKPVGVLETSPDYVAYLFEVPKKRSFFESILGGSDKSSVIVLWTKDVEYAKPIEVAIKGDANDIKVINLYGNKIPVKNNKFMLGRNLAYIVLDGITPERAKKIAKESFLSLKSVPGIN